MNQETRKRFKETIVGRRLRLPTQIARGLSPIRKRISFRGEVNQSRRYEDNRHIHLTPCPGFPPPLLERQKRFAIEVGVAGRSHDCYIAGGACRWINPYPKHSQALISASLIPQRIIRSHDMDGINDPLRLLAMIFTRRMAHPFRINSVRNKGRRFGDQRG